MAIACRIIQTRLTTVNDTSGVLGDKSYGSAIATCALPGAFPPWTWAACCCRRPSLFETAVEARSSGTAAHECGCHIPRRDADNSNHRLMSASARSWAGVPPANTDLISNNSDEWYHPTQIVSLAPLLPALEISVRDGGWHCSC